jgi:molecular chaperone Hsp33
VPGKLRAYARFEGTDLGRREGETAADAQRRLIGSGHLALTIDPGQGMERYQGIVALDGTTLTDAALGYFRQSEQLPTFIRIAVARHFANGQWTWRAGGLMVQRVASTGGAERSDLSDEQRDALLHGEEHEDWRRTRMLAETIEDHELLDPTLDPHRLLYRLFHEEGVRAREPQPLSADCRCSRERIQSVLTNFSATDMSDMREADGAVAVTCEFCSTVYRFQPGDLNQP